MAVALAMSCRSRGSSPVRSSCGPCKRAKPGVSQRLPTQAKQVLFEISGGSAQARQPEPFQTQARAQQGPLRRLRSAWEGPHLAQQAAHHRKPRPQVVSLSKQQTLYVPHSLEQLSQVSSPPSAAAAPPQLCRQSLWCRRQSLWCRRQSLWCHRQSLWCHRQSLWCHRPGRPSGSLGWGPRARCSCASGAMQGAALHAERMVAVHLDRVRDCTALLISCVHCTVSSIMRVICTVSWIVRVTALAVLRQA